MRTMLAVAVAFSLLLPAHAADTKDLVGNWKLISAQRQILDTNETVDAYGGARPSGWINYSPDGRTMVMIAHEGRGKPRDAANPTDEERAKLQKTILAYGGTFNFDGKAVTTKVDISWNEAWTGTTLVRDVQLDGNRLTLKTRPAPFSADGKPSIVTLVWEKSH
ncbi:lipocalin-like domain-containing protein [Methylobacterium durans]|nr:lipocalin-like domain-containing protein [Methylobacterium durans]